MVILNFLLGLYHLFTKKNISLLSEPVWSLPSKGKDYLTWADMFNGFGLFGSAGSGKTSGVLASLLMALLMNKHKPGGVIVCVKVSDFNRIRQMVIAAGREADLIVFSVDSPYEFNPIEYELFRIGKRSPRYSQALEVAMEICRLDEANQSGGGSSGGDDKYWVDQMKICITRAMMLLVLADECINFPNIRDLLVNCFDADDVQRYASIWEKIQSSDGLEQDKAIQDYEDWCASNYFLRCFDTANAKEDLLPDEIKVMQLVGDYFLKSWVKISEKTRSIIESVVFGVCERFIVPGSILTKLSGHTSEELKPENCYQKGKIILINFPLKEYGGNSVIANGAFKKSFQLAVERRDIDTEANPRPCFLYMDEYHLICNSISDAKFQSTCRSTRTAALYSTQSKTNLEVSMGGGSNSASTKTKALITNWGVQFFCANMCKETNEYASDLIGKTFIDMQSSSFNTDQKGSQSYSKQWHHLITPGHYKTLKSGGEENNFKVESIVVCRGKKWSTNEPFLEVTFDQLNPTNQTFFDRLKKRLL